MDALLPGIMHRDSAHIQNRHAMVVQAMSHWLIVTPAHCTVHTL
jgi:hypothetical protein